MHTQQCNEDVVQFGGMAFAWFEKTIFFFLSLRMTAPATRLSSEGKKTKKKKALISLCQITVPSRSFLGSVSPPHPPVFRLPINTHFSTTNYRDEGARRAHGAIEKPEHGELRLFSGRPKTAALRLWFHVARLDPSSLLRTRQAAAAAATPLFVSLLLTSSPHAFANCFANNGGLSKKVPPRRLRC